MDIPRAQPLPTGVTTANLGSGLAQGWETGNKMGYVSSQTTAQDLQNKYAPQAAILAQQKQQAEIAQQQAKAAKDKADAINGIGNLAPVLKLLPVSDAKKLLASHIAKLQSIYPDLPVDSKNVTDDNIDEVEQWAKGRPEIEAKGSPDTLTSYDSMWISKMGETQRDIIKDIKPVSPSEQFSQAETAKRTQENIGAENTRAAATATGPMVQQTYSVNLAKTALAKGDELNDHIAINEFGKLVNNGTPIPLPELKKMVQSGTWGPRLAQTFKTWTGDGALSDEQRTMMQAALDTIGESIKGAASTKASQIPGTTPPKLPAISAYKPGQVVKFDQGSYKKIKDGSDNDPSNWQLIPQVKK